ncbi:protein takeout-like [Eupeodes corollae]|uniref:protein takeout-like n=1 Tax=Eupeodes corollae TaxID=290404 RepID=UPI002490B4A8|nr:protein takeout-like [Eupeodes corollae]
MFRKIGFICIVFCFIYISFSEGKFPNDPKPCPYGNVGCIKKLLNFLLAEKTDGYEPLNIVSLNPLKISEIRVKQGKESPVFIDLSFKNSDLYGFKGAKATQIKGFGKDISQPHEMVISSKSMTLLSDYTISGKVLILPITGSGKSNLTMDNVKLIMQLNAEPLVKNGKTYMHVKKLKLDVETTRLHFDFKNLYNGDKNLGDSTNLFLNENWKDIFGEVRKTMTSAFASVFKKVINDILKNFPYDELMSEA